MPAGMTERRALACLRVLGWRKSDLLRELNRVARTTYKSGDLWKWFGGVRGVPLGVAIFLRMSVRLAVLNRRLQREADARRMNEVVVLAIGQLRELADMLECGDAKLLDVTFGDIDGQGARLAVDYRPGKAPAGRITVQ